MGNPSTSLTDKNFSLPLGFCQKRLIKVHGHWRNSLSLDGQKVFSVFDMVYQDFNPFDDAPAFEPTVLSVTALNRRVAQLLQSEFGSIWVRGEIRGFMQAASGHWYFTLKDEGAEVRCAMFAGSNRRLGFYPKTGDKVEVRARVSLYQPRGDYQLVVEGMRRAGLGNLYEQFLRLKEKLQREGLFDSDRKKPIPKMAMRIGVVTSLQAAALRDVITTLSRRAPYAQIVIYPSSVQGDEAPFELIEALRAAEQRQEVDVLLLVRGGGSLQDLWAFNDELVAKAIYDSNIPIISAVGHEPDVTISDYVADLRAATPSNAAELAVPDADALKQTMDSMLSAMQTAVIKQLRGARQHLNALATSPTLQSPTRYISQRRDALHHMKLRLSSVQQRNLDRKSQAFIALTAKLDAMSPLKVLSRGYAMARSADGSIIRSVKQVRRGEAGSVLLSDGVIDITIDAITEESL